MKIDGFKKYHFFQIHQFRNIPNILMKKYWEFVDLKNDIIWIHQIPNLKNAKCKKFSFILIDISHKLWGSMDGTQFYSSQTWNHFLTHAKQTASECNWCLFQITRFPIKVISNQPTFCMTERRRYSNWLILALLKELVKPLKIRSPNQDTLNVNESWPLVIWRILWSHHHHVVLVIRNEE